ncbi:MAG TPA: GNAT family N-acetyltransferase [Acidimicrobiales bacterium]|nr:GNAT family N-acetyltransferase [Acidimicrobiales bacterium]
MIIRQIEPTDAPALIKAHDHLSAETRRRRFFRAHPVLSEQEAEFFTNVDHVDREAFVATEGKYIVAVGRYDRVSDDAAEVAVVVGDPYQGQGIGSRLMRRLAKRAAEVGITHLVADTLGDNRAAIGLVRHVAPQRTSSFEAGLVHYDIELQN